MSTGAILKKALIAASTIKYVCDGDRFVGMPADQDAMRKAADDLAMWLSAALEDPNICAEMKRDINAWFDTGMPAPRQRG